MTIKMNLPNGTSIEGNAEELFELEKLLNGEDNDNKGEEDSKNDVNSIRVGDYVRVKDKYKDRYVVTSGEMLLGKVETTRSEGHSKDTVRHLYNRYHRYNNSTVSDVNLDYFEKVKTPSDRELSFLKAGREVGELRKGDIVKLEGFFIDRFHKVYDVYKDTADVGSFYEDISQMSLVTPVDERLDLSDDDK